MMMVIIMMMMMMVVVVMAIEKFLTCDGQYFGRIRTQDTDLSSRVRAPVGIFITFGSHSFSRLLGGWSHGRPVSKCSFGQLRIKEHDGW